MNKMLFLEDAVLGESEVCIQWPPSQGHWPREAAPSFRLSWTVTSQSECWLG